MGTVGNEVKVPTLVQADPEDGSVSLVMQALQLQPLSLYGVLYVPVEESGLHHVPLCLGAGAACGQNSAMSPQVLLGKSSWGLWAGLFPTAAVCGAWQAGSRAVRVNAEGEPWCPAHLCAVLESLRTQCWECWALEMDAALQSSPSAAFSGLWPFPSFSAR